MTREEYAIDYQHCLMESKGWVFIGNGDWSEYMKMWMDRGFEFLSQVTFMKHPRSTHAFSSTELKAMGFVSIYKKIELQIS